LLYIYCWCWHMEDNMRTERVVWGNRTISNKREWNGLEIINTEWPDELGLIIESDIGSYCSCALSSSFSSILVCSLRIWTISPSILLTFLLVLHLLSTVIIIGPVDMPNPIPSNISTCDIGCPAIDKLSTIATSTTVTIAYTTSEPTNDIK